MPLAGTPSGFNPWYRDGHFAASYAQLDRRMSADREVGRGYAQAPTSKR